MLKNYFRIALRSYGRNYLYTIINIVGMAVGLSGLILTFLLYDYEKSFDKQHKNTSSIFRVNSQRNIEGEIQKWGVVPTALGPIAAEENRAIEDFTRYGATSAFLVQFDDIIHRERINFADPQFFDLFSFKLLAGHKEVFKDKSKVIIFNGEIYNYRELREYLLKRGHIFNTATDTEVILHLYEEFGSDAVQHLNGIFRR